jgi:hypothetical protein
MGRYCSGCVTLKIEDSACVCRVLWDIDHLPYDLHQLRRNNDRVDDLLQRIRKVLHQLSEEVTAAAAETSGE